MEQLALYRVNRVTSLASRAIECGSGNADRKLSEYLSALRAYPSGASDREIAGILGWECAAVSARRNDAIRGGYIEEAGKQKSTTGRTVMLWRVK